MLHTHASTNVCALACNHTHTHTHTEHKKNTNLNQTHEEKEKKKRAHQYGVPMNDLRVSEGSAICADTPKSAVNKLGI